MDRRNFLKTLAILSLYAPFLRINAFSNQRIVVVGAGIIGTTIAYELSKLGVITTLIDKNFPGSGTTGSSFNWINATYPKTPYVYNYLAQLGIRHFKKIENELDFPIKWNGSLEWTNSINSQKNLIKDVKHLMNYPTHTKHNLINYIQASTYEPNVNFSKNENIVFSEDDAALNTDKFIQVLVDKIKLNGVNVLSNCKFKNIKSNKNKILSINTSQGEIQADQVVFACGIDTNKIFKKTFLKPPTPGIIIKSKPYKKVINKIIYGPGIHFYQQEDGRIIIGEQDILSASEFKTSQNYPPRFKSKSVELKYINKIRNIGKKFFNQINQLEFEEIKIGWRPIPLDEKPILGRLSYNTNIYLASMHSGISLAPIVGKYIAKELVEKTKIPLLNNFRPERFF